MEFLEGINPRKYQQQIFETCLENNCLVVLPTGIGKTLIGLMVAIERMKKHPGEKVLILAPTKPLAEQHLTTFKKHLPELFADMQLFTGKVNAEQRKKIWTTADIIFSTPQCIANDLKKYLYNLSEVCLLIEDEAHRCVKNYDYNYVAQKYKSQANHRRIIGLTASPGSETKKIKEICRNLSIDQVELRTRESSDVAPYLQELEFTKIEVEFPKEFAEIKHMLEKLFNQYVETLKRSKILWTYPSKINLINLQKKIMSTIARGNKNFSYLVGASACAQAIKLQHAIELLETQTLFVFNNYLKNLFKQAQQKKSKGVIKLVAKPEFNFIYMQTNELLTKGKEHPKLERLIELIKTEHADNKNLKIIVFTQFRDTATIMSKRLNALPNLIAKTFVGQAKKANTGMNQKEQKRIINEFSAGEINILCATCIAEEGLDIPEVNAVVFYEPIPSAIRAIQRAGRTARLQKGKLFILITKKTRDEAFYYVSRAREKSMHTAINKIQQELSQGKKFDVQKKLN
jgi:ERCC4-related helicase